MSQNDPRQVFVAQAEGHALSELEVYKLLSAAEIDLGSVKFVENEADISGISANDALVMVLRNDATASETLEMAALEAARAGVCAMVGAWAPGQSSDGIHPAAAKFTTAQIPWDAEHLKDELGSDCENAFLTPDGTEAEPNEVEPHECD